jgi:hypothetical protein
MDGVTAVPNRSFGGLRHSQSLNNISSLTSPRKDYWASYKKVR